MKAQELRVGNYYNHNTQGDDAVDVISGQDILDLQDDPLDDFFQPIPLTEEWLLKFGFESYAKHVNYIELSIKHIEPSKHIMVRVGLQRNYFTVFNHSECDSIDIQFITSIQHVHQLQNLYFALTGEELTIK